MERKLGLDGKFPTEVDPAGSECWEPSRSHSESLGLQHLMLHLAKRWGVYGDDMESGI